MNNESAIKALTSLGQESRLNLFRLIVQRSDQGITPSELIMLLGMPAATVSFHLKELLGAGLVTCTKTGRSLRYQFNPDQMNALIAFLTENCCNGKSCGEKRSASSTKRSGSTARAGK